jgi:hypothetical protein
LKVDDEGRKEGRMMEDKGRKERRMMEGGR